MKLTWQETRRAAGRRRRASKGFGQVVFERIGASLDGDIATEFRPEGFVCAVTIGAENLLPHQGLARGFADFVDSASALEMTELIKKISIFIGRILQLGLS